MNNKLARFIFLIITTFAYVKSVNAQDAYKFSAGITAGMGSTGSLVYSERYRKSEISSTVEILTRSSLRNSNFNLILGYQPKESISINGSIGFASYGFQYTGNVIASPVNFLSVGGFVARETYSTRLLEVGLSATYRIAYKNDITLIVQPGFAWYTNPKRSFMEILGVSMNSNNFSATLFTGFEIPITNNAFCVSIGLSTKVALDNFSRNFDFNDKFWPYVLGLQSTINYRFGAFKVK